MTGAGDIRDQQRQSWNRFSGGWEKWDHIVLPWLQPVADEMLRMLAVGEEADHLDVATGTGEPGLTIAGRLRVGRLSLRGSGAARPGCTRLRPTRRCPGVPRHEGSSGRSSLTGWPLVVGPRRLAPIVSKPTAQEWCYGTGAHSASKSSDRCAHGSSMATNSRLPFSSR